MPNGLLVDYHLDHGNGIEAIMALRARCGDLPAILITADRSPVVREQARAEGIQLLHKPLKPAALRALAGAMARAARGGGGVISSPLRGLNAAVRSRSQARSL